MPRTLRDGWATNGCAQAWTPASFRLPPGSRSHLKEEHWLDAPSMRGQPSGHGRRSWRPKVLGGTQFVMDHTNVGDTADEIHARLKCLQAMSSRATATRQGGQTLTKGGVQHASSFRLAQEFLRPFDGSLRHAPGNRNDPFLLGGCDSGGDQPIWPGEKSASSWPNGSFDLFPKRTLDAAWRGCPPVGTHQQWAHGSRTAAHLGEHAISKPGLARQADNSGQPPSRRDHQGQSHPYRYAPPFDAYFIRLDVEQIEAGLLNNGLMQPLAVMPCSISPPRHPSLIEPKSRNDGLERTAVSQQGPHDNDQLRRLAQPLQHGSSPCAKGMTTGATARALPLAIRDADVALFDLTSCGTCQVRATYLRHVHRFLMVFLHKHILPMVVAFFKSLPPFHQVVGLYQSSCSARISLKN